MMCSFVIVKKIKLMKRSLIYFCILFLGCQAVVAQKAVVRGCDGCQNG